jgi:hypothetical protein
MIKIFLDSRGIPTVTDDRKWWDITRTGSINADDVANGTEGYEGEQQWKVEGVRATDLLKAIHVVMVEYCHEYGEELL